jgi:hypothetical protein
MRALWRAYVRYRQPHQLQYELTFAVRFAAAKLIQLCGELMHHATELNATTGALLQLAANMFADPEQAAIDLLGIRAEDYEPIQDPT